jgi:hypothetical protein
MVTARDLTTGKALPHEPLRVVYLNVEEDQDELDRRVAAICRWSCCSSHELARRELIEARMRRRHTSTMAFASARERDPSRPRHSTRNLPLKLSVTPFCQGLPGLMKAVPMPCATIHDKEC